MARKWDAAGNQFSKSIIKLCAPLHCEEFDKVVLSLRKKYVSRGFSATKLSHFLWKLRRILAVKKKRCKSHGTHFLKTTALYRTHTHFHVKDIFFGKQIPAFSRIRSVTSIYELKYRAIASCFDLGRCQQNSVKNVQNFVS